MGYSDLIAAVVACPGTPLYNRSWSLRAAFGPVARAGPALSRSLARASIGVRKALCQIR